VSEGEHAVTGWGGAGGQVEALRLAGGGGGGHVTVSPAVGDHSAIGLSGGGTPGQGRVSVCALGVLLTSVCEGKDAGGTSGGGARVGNSLLQTETSQPHRVMAGSSCTAGQTQQDTDKHRESSHLREISDLRPGSQK